MYFNRSDIGSSICIHFVLLFLIFLSASIERIEGKLFKFDPIESRNVINAFLSNTIVSKHNVIDIRTFIVRPINAYIREKYKVHIYVYNEAHGKKDAPKKKVDKMNTFACIYTPR